jgi:hypothetical protein
MRLSERAIWWVLAAVVTLGCGERGAGGGEMTVTDSAGITMVANVDQGLWAPGEEWSLNEDLRIGTLEGDPEYQFGLIGWLTAGADGSIYVLDQQARHIRKFDASGRHVTTFSRAGSGPGELGEAATFIGRTAGDSLVVADLDNARLNLYSSTGRPLVTVPMDVEAGVPVSWANTASGVIARQSRQLPVEGRRAPTDTTDAIITLAPDATDADTLIRVPSGGTLSVSNDNPNVEIFAAEPIWAITDDLDVLYGMNDDYRIGIYRDGRLRRVFSKEFTRQRVTDADRRAVMEGLLGLFGDNVPAGALDQLSSLIRFHETFPVFAAIEVGPEGSLWVQRARRPSDLVASIEPNLRSVELLQRMGGSRWDVFDPEGRFLGPVEMPDRFIPRYFSGDYIYGVSRDEYDVEYVVRLRVVRP